MDSTNKIGLWQYPYPVSIYKKCLRDEIFFATRLALLLEASHSIAELL